MLKRLLLILVLFVSFVLVGCLGGKEEYKKISFFSYQMEIPKTWQQMDPNLISIKQIEKKIRLAYKDPNGQDNLNIAYTKIKQTEYNKNDIIQAILAKYKGLDGYKLIQIYSIDFDCNGKKDKLYIHKFSIKTKDKNGNDKTFYFVQGYTFYNNSVIVISFLGASEENIKQYEKLIQSLSCKK